jgi:hypothetical protein
VYAIYAGTGELRYIGRALIRSGLASRLWDHFRAGRDGNPKWDAVLVDEGCSVDVYAFDDRDETWVPSLELFLQAKFPIGLVNTKVC